MNAFLQLFSNNGKLESMTGNRKNQPEIEKAVLVVVFLPEAEPDGVEGLCPRAIDELAEPVTAGVFEH